MSYFNTKPLIYGLQQGMMKDRIELVMDHPANIAKALLMNEIDIGLVPVAILPEMKEYHLVTNYCIGCDGAVGSVCIFSEVPLEKVETILLDHQSRTSVALAKILLREFWKINPVFKEGSVDIIDEIRGTTAAVVIGDRALNQLTAFPYIYDLGLAWKQYSGLPFIFAAWVSNKILTPDLISDFNNANKYGIEHLDDELQNLHFTGFDLKAYYTQYISYDLNPLKKRGLELFLQQLKLTQEDRVKIEVLDA